jgi:hypothetical protein
MITSNALVFDLPEEPIVSVHTTDGRGFTPEEVAERCVDRLISVSDTLIPHYAIKRTPLKSKRIN